LNLVGVFLLGWPIYLLTGASGGPVRGNTNHFLPNMGAKGKFALFPGKWKAKVWQSDVGCVAVVAALAAWAVAAGSGASWSHWSPYDRVGVVHVDP
jgi:omega-6 fatty acid desaturase (delta-12 desaturase)